MSGGYSWQSYSVGSPFPEGTVRSGTDSDGTAIFVGRAFHEGDTIPAKVIPDKSVAYVSFNGEEVPKYDFEILRTGTLTWEPASSGSVPVSAVCVGNTGDGEKLYYGRCLYEGSQTPGKIQVSHGCLYISYNGKEIAITEYEVLVLK